MGLGAPGKSQCSDINESDQSQSLLLLLSCRECLDAFLDPGRCSDGRALGYSKWVSLIVFCQKEPALHKEDEIP